MNVASSGVSGSAWPSGVVLSISACASDETGCDATGDHEGTGAQDGTGDHDGTKLNDAMSAPCSCKRSALFALGDSEGRERDESEEVLSALEMRSLCAPSEDADGRVYDDREADESAAERVGEFELPTRSGALRFLRRSAASADRLNAASPHR
jgi:hypothetical protein